MRVSTSRKRSIITPHPTTVALIQSSYQASRPVSSRRLRCGGKHQFTTELDAAIQTQLNECQTDYDKNQVYRNAFSVVIEKYKNYSLPMNLIKSGYENLIDKLLGEIQTNQKEKESTLKMQNKFQNLFEIQKKEIENQKQYYNNLSLQTQEQIGLLTNEVSDLTAKLAEIEENYRDEDYIATQNWSMAQDYVKKCEKKEAKYKRLNDYYESLENKQNEINQTIQDTQISISDSLDNILSKERQINTTNNSINSLKDDVEKQKKILEEKRNSLTILKQKNSELNASVKNCAVGIENINTENASIYKYLNRVMKLKSASAHPEAGDILGLTQRFASTLRPRRQVHDEATSTT